MNNRSCFTKFNVHITVTVTKHSKTLFENVLKRLDIVIDCINKKRILDMLWNKFAFIIISSSNSLQIVRKGRLNCTNFWKHTVTFSSNVVKVSWLKVNIEWILRSFWVLNETFSRKMVLFNWNSSLSHEICYLCVCVCLCEYIRLFWCIKNICVTYSLFYTFFIYSFYITYLLLSLVSTHQFHGDHIYGWSGSP